MSAPDVIARRREVERAVEEAELEHLLRALCHGEAFDIDDALGVYRVPCVTGCQADTTSRVVYGPRARIATSNTWTCECGVAGTIWLARRLVLEDARALAVLLGAGRAARHVSG